MAYTKRNPNGQAASANSSPAVLSTEQQAILNGIATQAKQDQLLAELELKADLTQTQPVSVQNAVSVNSLPTGNNSIGQVTANAGTNLNTSALNLESTQSLIKAKTDNLDVALSTRLKPSDTLAKVATVDTITNALPAGNNSIGQVATNATIFTFSPTTVGGNSTVTQLLAGQTFTGGIESVISQQSYSNLFFADQNCTIVYNQFIDAAGTKLISTQTYSYVAGATSFARSGVLNGNYFQAIITNNGASPTTTLQHDVAYGTIPSVTLLGNAPSSINEVNGLALSLGQKTSANSIPTVPSSDDSLTGQSAQTATVNNILTPTSGAAASDVSAYRSFNCQVVSTGTAGTFIFEGSNDNTNFQAIPVYNQALTVRVPIVTAITATVSQIIYEGSCNFRFLRLRIATTITGGSIQAFTNLIQTPLGTSIQIVGNGTAANLLATVSGTGLGVVGAAGHSAAVSGNPVYGAGKALPTTIATVDTTLVAGDAVGLPVTVAQQLATKPFGTSELDSGLPILPIVTTVTPQSIFGASGIASVRNYISQLSIQTDTLGAAGNMFILDNQGAIGTSVTIATPGVFTSAAHDLKVGDAIIFTSLGTITGISINTIYYITATSLAATTFTVATTPGGTAIAITGSTSAFTFYRVFYMFRLNTSALATPYVFTPPNPWRAIANSNMNVYFPSSLVSGAVYLNVVGYRGF